MTPYERAKACIVGLPLSPQQAHEYEERIASAIMIAVMKEREEIARMCEEQVGSPCTLPGVRLVVIDELAKAIRERGRG